MDFLLVLLLLRFLTFSAINKLEEELEELLVVSEVVVVIAIPLGGDCCCNWANLEK